MDNHKKNRQYIIYRYCRKIKNGHIATCGKPTTKRKVIFDSEEDAKQAAKELFIYGNSRELEYYKCPRSRKGHYHLTTKSRIETTDEK